MISNNERLAYKIGETAALLGIGERSVRDLVDSGKLRYVRMAGGQRLIPRCAIDEYLGADNTRLSAPKPKRAKKTA